VLVEILGKSVPHEKAYEPKSAANAILFGLVNSESLTLKVVLNA
jgi:hypothetical protein